MLSLSNGNGAYTICPVQLLISMPRCSYRTYNGLYMAAVRALCSTSPLWSHFLCLRVPTWHISRQQRIHCALPVFSSYPFHATVGKLCSGISLFRHLSLVVSSHTILKDKLVVSSHTISKDKLSSILCGPLWSYTIICIFLVVVHDSKVPFPFMLLRGRTREVSVPNVPLLV